MNSRDPRELYDDSSGNWRRDEPTILSDYTARPFLLDWCHPIKDKSVIDLGCGEGYVSRMVARRGASEVTGIDLSPEMIRQAKTSEKEDPLGISYSVGDVRNLASIESDRYDIALAIFLFSYIDLESMNNALTEVFRLLRPGGRLVLSIPHPAFPFIKAAGTHFSFDAAGGYFSSRDKTFEGKISRRDGIEVPVQCVHKTIEDVFISLSKAGFSSMPHVAELSVTQELLDLDSEFFGPLADFPLHLALRVFKEE